MIWEWLVLLTAGAGMVGGLLPASEVTEPKVAASAPGDDIMFQIRIQQRVIIRVPRQSFGRLQLSTAEAERRMSTPMRTVEKKMGNCVAADQLVAVMPAKSRALDFVTTDNRRVRAYLDGGCLAADFHAGLYIERNKDGKICAERDILMARSGMRCEIDRFRSVEYKAGK